MDTLDFKDLWSFFEDTQFPSAANGSIYPVNHLLTGRITNLAEYS